MQGFCDKIGANCDEIVSWAGQGQEEEEPVGSLEAVASRYDLAAKLAGAAESERNNAVATKDGRLARIKNRVKRRLGLRNRSSGAKAAVQQ